mgnify:CR=1 FL=1
MTVVSLDGYRDPLVVVTRPFPDCTRTAHQAEEVGFETFEEPLGVVSYFPLSDNPLPDACGVVLTSHRAVHSLSSLSFRKTPVFYVVGERTALTLRQNGFEDIAVTCATVENLLQWMGKHAATIRTPMVYLRGRDISAPVLQVLQQKGFETEEHIVYAVDQTESFSEEFKNILKADRTLIIIIMSARTADSFVKLTGRFKRDSKADLRFLCYSPKIAQIIEKEGYNAVEYCDDPTEDSLIQKLMLMYDEKI